VQLAERGASERRTVPYSAVIYWIDGGAWVYTQVAQLTFVRAPIVIEEVDGDVAVLRSGPPAGTRVVSVGGQELLGTEFQIEGE
jgi:glutamine amidotransferase PdxT